MIKKTSSLILLILVFMALGCSKATLSTELAIYTGELQTSYMNETELDYLLITLDNKRIKAEKIAKDRTLLAEKTMEILYLGCLANNIQSAQKCTDKWKQGSMHTQKEDFITKVESQKELIISNIDAIKKLIAMYRERLNKPDPNEASLAKSAGKILKMSERVEVQTEKLAGPLETKFENEIASNANLITKVALERAQKNNKNAYNKLKQEINKLSNVQRDTKAQIEEKPIQVKIDKTDNQNLNEIAKSLSLQTSQIYRLQDPADPIWKIVTKKENLSKWNVMGGRTFASADGEVNIVMVQDTPMNPRIQKVHGDPSSTIESQLMIGRAVSSTALQIAQMATGTKLPSIPSVPPSNKSDDAQQQVQQSASLGTAKVKLSSLQTKYEAAKRKFIRRLEELNKELATATKANIPSIASKINGALEAFIIECNQMAQN
ncbi:hypothetical protein [Maridesulfovibrio salexigens]|uniref:Lipoprotein n=1 Tax=Maridesulfovibrio salexigens (strain ATCC 14822 / DSM 2638 / NCIMB 8403 / VKM B-1763) TaxID=526222 RepID=C6BWD4_MARSD|nr:hypothetical protein [Maridesulfovibrio salexigens]ACS78378.1 hypothetical protein Desal_0311 [Maridesulfovibrio salexigens DSM 2638]